MAGALSNFDFESWLSGVKPLRCEPECSEENMGKVTISEFMEEFHEPQIVRVKNDSSQKKPNDLKQKYFSLKEQCDSYKEKLKDTLHQMQLLQVEYDSSQEELNQLKQTYSNLKEEFESYKETMEVTLLTMQSTQVSSERVNCNTVASHSVKTPSQGNKEKGNSTSCLSTETGSCDNSESAVETGYFSNQGKEKAGIKPESVKGPRVHRNNRRVYSVSLANTKYYPNNNKKVISQQNSHAGVVQDNIPTRSQELKFTPQTKRCVEPRSQKGGCQERPTGNQGFRRSPPLGSSHKNTNPKNTKGGYHEKPMVNQGFRRNPPLGSSHKYTDSKVNRVPESNRFTQYPREYRDRFQGAKQLPQNRHYSVDSDAYDSSRANHYRIYQTQDWKSGSDNSNRPRVNHNRSQQNQYSSSGSDSSWYRSYPKTYPNKYFKRAYQSGTSSSDSNRYNQFRPEVWRARKSRFPNHNHSGKQRDINESQINQLTVLVHQIAEELRIFLSAQQPNNSVGLAPVANEKPQSP